MHIVALFGLLIFTFLRVLGFVISLEFLFDLKEPRFKVITLGWFLWIIAGCSAIISGVFENKLLSDIFLLINGIFASNGTLFVMMGLLTYYRKLPRKSLIIICCIFTSVPLITFLIGVYDRALNISFIFVFLVTIFYTVIPLKKKSLFKTELSIKSYYWSFILIIFIYVMAIFYIIFILQGYTYGFYSDDFSFPMFFNYLLGSLITIIILIHSIHLEYDISNIQKYKLKDKYSHDLGNLIQVIYSATDLTNVNEDLTQEKTDNLGIIQKKCEEAARLIKEIKKIE